MEHGPTLKLILVIAIVLLALVAGMPPLLRKARGRGFEAVVWAEALAAGIFLGAGLIHMLADADGDFIAAGIDYPWSMVICGAVLLGLLWLEHFGNKVARVQGGNVNTLPLLSAGMLSAHSFLAGAAFGTSSTTAVTLVIFFAVIAHKAAASFALAQQLAQSALRTAPSLWVFAVFVAMFPAGALVGQGVVAGTEAHPLLEAVFASLAAGTFLYFGTLNGLAGSALISSAHKLREFAMLGLGFTLMALVAVWT